jgi:hypothetical protein
MYPNNLIYIYIIYLIMTFSNKTIQKFIEEDILISDNVSNILDKCKTQNEKGFVYERLWDLVFKFGVHPNFLNNQFAHMLGNSNKGKIKEMKSLKQYVQDNNIISGNSGGCSDITLLDKVNDKYIFMTCKYPKSDEDKESSKSVDYYDVQKIISMRDDNKEIYKKFDIYTLVPDKKKVLKKVKDSNSSSKHMTKYITDDKIFDENDLNKLFIKLKLQLEKYQLNEYDNVFLDVKESLSFPFHQRLIERRTSNLISQGEKTILWGCKPRSGKTYMTGDLIIEQSKITPKYNVLIITPAPTETSPQFTDDLFKKYREFENFKITHFKTSKMKDKFEFGDNNIIVVSKQLLQMYTKDNTLKEIKDLKLNLIVFDENHFGGTTDRSEEILESYISKNTVKLYLTATYNKSLKKWKVPQDCQIFWDIEDEQFCKQKNINGLVEKHGDIVAKVLKNMEKEGFTQDEIMNEYQKYPDLHILTTMFDSQRWDIIKDSIMESKYGFSMDVLFSLSKGKKKEFLYPNEVKKVLQFVSGDKKEENFKDKDLSMFTRINAIKTEHNSRQPFTQLWFLPVNGINNISENLKKIMLEDDILKQYDVYIVNSKSNDEVDDVKGEINKREIIAKENKKRGLIILAGNMLTLGITLSLCDIVFLMNDTLSSDKVMQMMYRSMTESKKKDKKCGFVIDMKISRVLQACISYNVHKKMHNTEEKIKFLMETHLINIDSDYLIGKKIDGEKIISKLLDIWKSDPINNLNILLRQIEDDIVEMDNVDQKSLNKYFAKSVKGDTFDVNIELKDEEDKKQDIKNGKEIIKTDENESKNNDDTESEDEKEDEKISLTKDVLPFAIPFVCLLTLKDNNNDFVEMLNTISKDPELLEIFNEQSFIWWNNKDIIELIKQLTTKYIEKNSNTFNIAIIIKMTLKSLIDKPKELLEFISERLKPKQKEKKEFGEVFTPMKLVGEMLDKIDEYYKKENKISIFSNKNLKWLDPASGMGNFPIELFMRLMKGLKDEIKEKNKRKKHILENMIYMSELNKKNVNICKQIFDVNNEFNLNMNQGDSLKLNTEKKWGIKNFDVVMGNPPYQDNSGNRGKGHTLWTKFVESAINNLLNKDGYLIYIHPSLWRQADHEMLTLMKSKQICYLEIHDEKDGQKTFKCSTRYDWYVLQNTKYTKNTDIKGQDEKMYNIDLRKWNFIPNCMFDRIEKMLSKNDNVEILYSRSDYASDKKWTSKIKDTDFKYPCVYSVNRQNELKFIWSMYNDKGHFNIPKVVFGSGATGFYIDKDGEYGLSEFATGIIDDKKNLSKIKEAIESNEFKEIIKAISVSKAEINRKVLKYFKKDFYNEFIKKDTNPKNNDSNEKNTPKKKNDIKKAVDKNIKKIESSSDSDEEYKKPKKVVKKANSEKSKKKIEINSDSESDSDSSSDDEKYSKKKNISKK